MATNDWVTVLAPALPGASDGPSDGNPRVLRWRGYRLGPFRWLPHAYAVLSEMSRHDAVLAMNPAYAGPVCAALRSFGRGRPYLAWAYGLEILKARDTPLAALYRAVFGNARCGVAISRFTRDRLLDLGIQAERLQIVPPGVTLPCSESAPLDVRSALDLPTGPIVVTVGRLVRRKGHDTLARAMSQVISRAPDALWVVCGRGPEGRRLASTIAELPGRERMFLVGHVSDSVRDALYREAVVMAMTPRGTDLDAEGFGLVYLEGGSYSLPVVATRCGGIPDAVEHDVTGLLVPPDETAATRDAILALLDRPEWARTLGVAGRARAERSTWDGAATAIEALLQ